MHENCFTCQRTNCTHPDMETSETCADYLPEPCVWCGSHDTRIVSRGVETVQHRCDSCDRFFRVVPL